MRKSGIKIVKTDTVITVTQHVYKMDEIIYQTQNGEEIISAKEEIPQFHKAACQSLKRGDTVLKYGEAIGVATADIEIGEYVHTHNLKSACMVEEQNDGNEC